jgi:intracellular multiplication protein IcmP
MSKNKHAQSAGSDNNEMMMFIAICLISVLFWWAFKTRIAGLVLGIRLIESYFISFFTGNLDELRLWMSGIDRRLVTLSDMYVVSAKVGAYMRFVTTPILGYLGYVLYKRSPTERFKRRFNQHTLPIAEANLYPWMKISTEIKFDEMDPERGPWAYAKTERMFARDHKLRDEKGGLDKEKATRAFIKQLGPLWMGYGRMKPHAKALFAMLAARVNRDFSASDAMIIQLAKSASEGKLDYTGVDALAKKYIDTKPMKRLIRWHAYERTLLMSMLDLARGGDTGKDALPPNFFLWLKGVERPLWYALSDVGRKTPHVESAGVFAHWLTERERKRKLEMPFVENAVSGLEIELGKLTEDGDQEFDDDQDLIVVKRPPPLPKAPSPKELEQQRQMRAGMRGGAPSEAQTSSRNARSSRGGDDSALAGMMVMGIGPGGVAMGGAEDFMSARGRGDGAGGVPRGGVQDGRQRGRGDMGGERQRGVQTQGGQGRASGDPRRRPVDNSGPEDRSDFD